MLLKRDARDYIGWVHAVWAGWDHAIVYKMGVVGGNFLALGGVEDKQIATASLPPPKAVIKDIFDDTPEYVEVQAMVLGTG